MKLDDFLKNKAEALKRVRRGNDLVDVTVAGDDGSVEAHKLILSTGSSFFREVLQKTKHQHPYIYIKTVKVEFLENILDFLYCGETNVDQQSLDGFFAAAKILKIEGLSERSDTAEIAEKPSTSVIDEKNLFDVQLDYKKEEGDEHTNPIQKIYDNKYSIITEPRQKKSNIMKNK